jgi:hypothetical protein
MKEAAAFEMRAALKLGVDGFQFYYPNVLKDDFHAHYINIIRAHFQAANEQKIPFLLTLCLSIPRQGSEAEKTDMWARHIGELLKTTRDSEHWARSPDGRIIMYLYWTDSLSDAVGNTKRFADTPEEIAAVALAHQKLAETCGIRAAFIYPIRHPEREDLVQAALDWFPALWDWIDVDPAASDASWRRVAAICKSRGRSYTQTVHGDYYGSKLYEESEGKHRLLFSLDEILSRSPQQLMRDCEPTKLSGVLRQQLDRALDLDVLLINYVTWNDFPEGHHLAPEVNHNFGFPMILKDYKRRWLGQRADGKEQAAVFYKKYSRGLQPKYFPMPYRLKNFQANEAEDDFIEVVSILSAPAEVWIRGHKVGDAAPGLSVTRVPSSPGNVDVEIRRSGKLLLRLDPPEGITAEPCRTDRLTYAWTSEDRQIFKELYGENVEMPVSDEYHLAPNGVPNWKLRYNFWISSNAINKVPGQ